MRSHKSLSLPRRLELTHPSLSHPRRLIRLLCPVIGVALCIVNDRRNKFPMGNTVATQFVCHDLPELATMAAQ